MRHQTTNRLRQEGYGGSKQARLRQEGYGVARRIAKCWEFVSNRLRTGNISVLMSRAIVATTFSPTPQRNSQHIATLFLPPEREQTQKSYSCARAVENMVSIHTATTGMSPRSSAPPPTAT